MGEEEATSPPFFWLQNGSPGNWCLRRRGGAYSLFVSTIAFLILLLVIALALHSLISHSFELESVNKNWYSLNLLLVLFTILCCGFLNNNTAKMDEEDEETEQSKTEQSKPEQSKTEQSKTEQSETEHSKTEQSETEQSKTEQSETEQSKTEQSMKNTEVDTFEETQSTNQGVVTLKHGAQIVEVNFHALIEKVIVIGNEIFLPPPQPPFDIPPSEFEGQGDFVSIDSLLDSDEDDDISLFYETSDVDSEAENYIKMVKAGWRMEKMQSIRENQGIGSSNLFPGLS